MCYLILRRIKIHWVIRCRIRTMLRFEFYSLASFHAQLVMVYHKQMDEKDVDDDAADIFDTSLSVTRAIITILDACSSLPDTISQMEHLLMPMMERMCDKSGVDVFDQVSWVQRHHNQLVSPSEILFRSP